MLYFSQKDKNQRVSTFNYLVFRIQSEKFIPPGL